MKSKSVKILQIIIGVYAVLYLIGFIIPYFTGELSFSNNILGFLLFLLFMLGFALSWTSKKIAGIIFMVYNLSAWILGLFIDRSGGGLGLVLAVPVLVMGALLYLQWYKTSMTPPPSKQQQWKFILRVLLINYAVLYVIMVFSELTHGAHLDFYNFPAILFPILLLVFLVGFALSWKREYQAGLIFLFWYLIVLFGLTNYEFRDSGPWGDFGITILLQGIFYIYTHFQYRPKG